MKKLVCVLLSLLFLLSGFALGEETPLDFAQLTGLDKARELYRQAQWFFDFCYVENSEGAHTSDLAARCLDTSEARIEEALALFP